MKHLKIISILFVFVTLLQLTCLPTLAADIKQQESEVLEGRVERIVDEAKVVPAGSEIEQYYQKLEIAVTKGSLLGKTIEVESGLYPMANQVRYRSGDQLLIEAVNYNGEVRYFISDYIRRKPLLLLSLLFLFVTLIVGRRYGFFSILGMIYSFAIIFRVILPAISQGADPVTVAIIGSVLIVPASFYLSHGFNKKTSAAIIGTVISLMLIGFLATFFVEISKLSGFSSEEAGFLQINRAGLINMKGLLLAGIIISALGVFDDITTSQASIVNELILTGKKLTNLQIYVKAMNVGHDHIASMVNTLILVYAGAALPLLLLFVDSSRPITEILNYEFIAEEIVRTLVASIGLVMAVPITTMIAVLMMNKGRSKNRK